MVERTLKSLETFQFLTRLGLINQRVELLFFPSVTVSALLQSFASFIVTSDECARLPVLTKFGVIPKKVGFTPEILEIMCINALCLIMLVIVGTPFRFKVKYVKVKVLVRWQQMMNQTHLNIFN